MSPDEQDIAALVKNVIEPPMRITSEFVGALLELIVAQGTQKMKAEALVISQRFMSRIGEWT